MTAINHHPTPLQWHALPSPAAEAAFKKKERKMVIQKGISRMLRGVMQTFTFEIARSVPPVEQDRSRIYVCCESYILSKSQVSVNIIYSNIIIF